MYDALAKQGQLNVTKRLATCPEEEDGRSTSAAMAPQLSNRILLQQEINGDMHVFTQSEDAIEIFVYSEQGCERRQRLSTNGSAQECINSQMQFVCVLLDQPRRRIEVLSLVAPSTIDAIWASELLWEKQYSVQLTRPYLFESQEYTFYLIFGAADRLVTYNPIYFAQFTNLPPGLGPAHELYKLNSGELIVAFGASAYTYSLQSARLSSTPYITSLANYVITDVTVATNDSSSVSATIFSNTAVQVVFTASKCAFMQLPRNTQVERVEFFSWNLLLLFVAFDNHSTLYTVDVNGIGELLGESAESCRNVSFEDHSTPILPHNNTGGRPCYGSFNINGLFLFASNCIGEDPMTDLYILDPVKYIGTLDGVVASDLDTVSSAVNPSQCVDEIVSGKDTPLPTDVITTPSHPTTNSPATPSSNIGPGTGDQTQLGIVLGLSLAALVAIGIVVTLTIIFVGVYCSKGHQSGEYSPRKAMATTNSYRASPQDIEHGANNVHSTTTERDSKMEEDQMIDAESGDEGIDDSAMEEFEGTKEWP